MPRERTNVVFVGEACSGKTALLYRLLGFEFPEDYKPTVGYRSLSKFISNIELHYDDNVGNHSPKADIIVCTVDLTDNFSLMNMHHHIRHAVEASKNQNVRVLVVATKSDLTHKSLFDVSI